MTNTSHIKQERFLYEYPLHWVLRPKRMHNRTLLLGNTLLNHGHPFDYWNQPPNVCGCYPRLSWSWTVLLPSDTYRRPITSITTVILHLSTYLLTVPRRQLNMLLRKCWKKSIPSGCIHELMSL
jgi:hypothetical protein